MKKIILAAIAVMAFGFANAQQTRFGIKGGLNMSTVVGGDVDNTKSLVGFHVGGFAEIHVVEKFLYNQNFYSQLRELNLMVL